MGKYDKLADYLKNSPRTTVTLSAKEIEGIIGSKLPSSAYKHRAWWSNNHSQHSHRAAWLNAGWKVDEVGVKDGESFDVTFRKTDGPAKIAL